MPKGSYIPLEVYEQPADVTYVATPPIPESVYLTQGPSMQRDPGAIGVTPDLLSIQNPNSAFWDLPETEQRKIRTIMKWGGMEAVKRAGYDIEPPEYPHGTAAGAQKAFLEGLGVPPAALPEVRGESPLASGMAGLAGEVGKYVGLYRVLPQLGLGGFPLDLAVGATSGAIRQIGAEEPSLTAISDEMLAAGAIGGAFRTGAALAKGAPKKLPTEAETIANSKANAPLTDVTPQQEAVVLSSFGYTPEVATSIKKAWTTGVDRVAKAAVDKMPPKIRNFLHSWFVSAAPPEARQILLEAEKRRFLGRSQARELGEQIRTGVPEELQFDLYRALDPKALGEDIGVAYSRLTPETKKVWDLARNRLDALGREAVALDLLDPDVYMSRLGEYMGRFYRTKEPTARRIRGAFKRFFIKGERFRRRTLKTPEQREALGLITDPAYAVSRTVADLTFDIETAKAFRRIAKNTEWTKPVESYARAGEAAAEGFTQVPIDAKYGDLSGKWLNSGIADEIFAVIPRSRGGQYGREIDNLFRVYDRVLGLWKLGKTAWSPATQGRNFFSNIILADVGAELSPLRVDIYAKALKDYLKKGKFYREAEPTGLWGTDWFAAEIGAVLTPSKLSKGSTIFDALSDNFAGKVLRAPGRLYQGTEHFFKMAVYIHRRGMGWSPDKAAAHAHKYLFNYSDLSPALKRMRRAWWGGPFLSFTAKALPVMAESAVKRPVRFWKYPIMLRTLHEYSKTRLGITEEEWDRINLSLPEWRRNGFNILMPSRGKGEKPQLLDLTFNLPWGQIAESPSLVKHIPGLKDLPLGVVDPFVGSNPFTNFAADVLFNRSRFLDKPLHTFGDRPLQKIGEHAYKQFTPGIMQAIPPVYEALTGKPTKYGEERGVFSTLLNKMAGIKIIDVDVGRGLQIRASKLRGKVDELKRKAYSLTARLEKGGIGQEDYDREMARLLKLGDSLETEADELEQAYENRPKKLKLKKKRQTETIPAEVYQ